MVNGSRLIGPAVAGILIAAFGEGVCFLINALSYLAVIAALLSMKIFPRTDRPVATEIMKELKDGFRYAYDFLPIRSLLMLTMAVSVMMGAFQTLIPVFVKDIFHGGPQLFGFLVTASGVGAFLAAFYLAGRKSVLGLSRLIMFAAGAIGVGIMIFSFVKVLWIAAIASFIVGLGMIIQIGGSNIVLQTLVDEEKRGRVMSLYGMAFIGMTPFGSLLAGFLAGKIGVEPTLLLGGAGCLLAALVFWRNFPRYRAEIRPVYVQKGILPEA
jgi:MFS family permease